MNSPDEIKAVNSIQNISPSEKTFEARQKYIERTKKNSKEKTSILVTTEVVKNEFDSKMISSNPFTVQSDKHLLASLTSARGSIVSLETANKDLLDALSSRHNELEKAKADHSDLLNRYKTQSEQVINLQKDVNRLHESVTDRDQLLSSRDDEIKDARIKIEELLSHLR